MTPLHPLPTRREFLRDSCCGLGSLALASLLHDDLSRASLPPRVPRRADAKGRAAIFLFMAAGPGPRGDLCPEAALESAARPAAARRVRRAALPVHRA